MYAVILAGGGGTRLRPLSRTDRPKPFLPLIDNRTLIQHTVDRVASVPGLRGWVGVDLVLPDDGPPVVVEINPRLTTSYLGYRRLTGTNLAERWLRGAANGTIAWGRRRVDFRPDGEVVSAAPAPEDRAC